MRDEQQHTLAMFIDFENLVLGLRNRDDKFEIRPVLARLLEKGNVVVKRAYADWKRFAPYCRDLHEEAIELIEVPARGMTGKNSADMRLCVDAMDLSYSKQHINMFVILSGDSDFSPLVSKLRENSKTVIGIGMKDSTSALLRDNCDEFIFYENLISESRTGTVPLSGVEGKKENAFQLLMEALNALRRENREILWSSLIKTTMKRKSPSFSESTYGYKSFSRLLEDAAQAKLIELSRDEADRTYIVSRFGSELQAPVGEPKPVQQSQQAQQPQQVQQQPQQVRPPRRRSRRRSPSRPAAAKPAAAS